MTNVTLKKLIEKEADCWIRLSTHKCYEFEGYADAYSNSVDSFVVNNKRYPKPIGSPTLATACTYAARSVRAARRDVLVSLAKELAVVLPDGVENEIKDAEYRAFQNQCGIRN